MGINDLIEEDAGRLELPSDEALKKIADLAKRQLQLEEEIVRVTEHLSSLQHDLDELRDKTLSDLVLGLGISEIRLSTGGKLKVERLIFTSIKGERKDEAIAWLEGNDFAGLVKSSLVIDGGKDSKEQLEPVMTAAIEAGLLPRYKQDVHPQTLKAFVTEQLDKGTYFPQDLFSIHLINRVKIK
jgi:NAD-dependent DNA ligase